MKSKQLITMFALLVGTLAMYLLLSPKENDSAGHQAETGTEPLAHLKLGDIAAIAITTSEGKNTTTVRIEKTDGRWTVLQRGDYPADTSRIEALVKNLTSMKILRRVPASQKQLGRLHLDDPGTGKTAATKVELFTAEGKALKTVHLGKAINAPGGEGNTSAFGGGGFPDRRFVMLDAKPSSAAVVDQTFSNANTDAADWINRTDFFDVKNVLSLAVEYSGAEATNSWKLTRENTATNWTLIAAHDGEVLDPDKLNSFAQPLQSPTFNDVLTGDAANLGTNATRITLGTEDNFTYTLTLGEPNADGEFPMQLTLTADLSNERVPTKDEKPADKTRLDTQWQNQQQQLKIRLALHQMYSGREWTFLIPGYTVSGLLTKRDELMAEKPLPGPIGPISPIGPVPPIDPVPTISPKPPDPPQ